MLVFVVVFVLVSVVVFVSEEENVSNCACKGTTFRRDEAQQKR